MRSQLASAPPGAAPPEPLLHAQPGLPGHTAQRGLQLAAFKQLALANMRELVRDKVTLVFTTLFPLAFLAMFAIIPSNAPAGRTTVAVVAQAGSTPARVLAKALSDRRMFDERVFPTLAAGRAAMTDKTVQVLVRAEKGGVIDVSGPADQTGLYLVRQALLQATRAPGSASVDVVGSTGTTVFNSQAFGVPAVLVLGFSSLALLGTAAPIILLRQKRTLRLIGLTPCSRLTFVLAQVPARLAIGLFDLAAAAVAGTAWGVLDIGDPLALVGVVALGLGMLFALGYFCGGVIRSPELGNGLLAGLMPVLLMVSGVLLPLQLMPSALTSVARYSPLAHFGSLLRHELVGAPYTYPPLQSVLVMVATIVVVTLLTVVTFRWDELEAR